MNKEKKKLEFGSLDKYRYLFLPVGVLILAVFMLGVMVFPKIGEIKTLRGKIEKNENLTEEAKNKTRLLQSIDEETLKKQSRLAVMALPDKKDVYNLVTIMNDVALVNGFKVESFKIGLGELGSQVVETEESADNQVSGVTKKVEPKKEVKLEKLPIEVELVGSKDEYLNLLLAMEEAIPLLSINKLDLKSKGDSVVMEMTVAIYFSPALVGVDLDKISLSDLMMTEEELLVVERLESFENYVLKNETRQIRKPEMPRDNPFEL